MSDLILSALVNQQHKENPAAATLIPPFTTPDAVTLDMLEVRAQRQFTTDMPGRRKALAAAAWEMHQARCRAAAMDATPPVITPAAVEDSPPSHEPKRTPRKRVRLARPLPRTQPLEWGGIQVIPIRGQADRVRLVVDRTLDREWALRLAATICNVLAEVQ